VIRDSEEVQRAIADDHEKLIDLVINIEKLTDPEDAAVTISALYATPVARNNEEPRPTRAGTKSSWGPL